MFTAMIKSRFFIDFRFYKSMDSLNIFEGIGVIEDLCVLLLIMNFILHPFYEMS